MGPLLSMFASACKCVFFTVAFSSQMQTCEHQIVRKTPKTSMSREPGCSQERSSEKAFCTELNLTIDKTRAKLQPNRTSRTLLVTRAHHEQQ